MDIILHANSSGKPRAQRMQPVRLTEHLNPKVTKSDVKRNVRERAQPVRIIELLGPSDNVNTIKKCNTSERKKKVQPERLLALCTNVRKPKPTERYESTICPLILPTKSVRRTLKFNDFSTNQPETTKKPKTVTKIEHSNRTTQNSANKSSYRSTTTTKRDVQKCKAEKVRRHSKIPQISKSQRVVRNISKDFHSMARRSETKSIANCTLNKISQESESPAKQTEKVKVHRKTNVSENKQLPNNRVNIEKRETKSTCKSIKSAQKRPINRWTTAKCMESLMCTSSSSIDDLCLAQETNSRQICAPNESPTKFNHPGLNIFQSSCMNDSQLIHVKKDEFLSLKETLETLVQRTEEDLYKLKSVLSHITKFSETSCQRNIKETIEPTNPEAKTETFTTKETSEIPSVIHNNMKDKEVQVGTCCNAERSFNSPASASKLQTVKVSGYDLNDIDADKENKRSKSMPANDSFLQMEEELQIKHAKELPSVESEQQATPALRRLRRKSTRSLREYIALKSNIRFLKTPDTKSFRSICDDDSDKLSTQRHISIKLLSDLQNLYADSPSSVSQAVSS